METELRFEVLNGQDAIPPFSARGCIQTLEPIQQGELHRTVNGDLILVGGYKETKYKSKITCKDKQGIALGGIVVGAKVRIGSIQRLVESVSAEDQKISLKYPYVPDSLYFMTENQTMIKMNSTTLPKNHGAGYVSYRPEIDMRITAYKLETDEWGMTVGWEVELEEI